AVGLVLPYTIEFTGEMMAERYVDIARFVGFSVASSQEGARLLAQEIRNLARSIKQPLSLQEAGISAQAFEAALPKLIENAESDATLVASARIPDSAELERLYRYTFAGKSIDF
ncbi:MAG: NAD-dependent alcohol dehydrogenase, partial [Anaerolineae bacterium]